MMPGMSHICLKVKLSMNNLAAVALYMFQIFPPDTSPGYQKTQDTDIKRCINFSLWISKDTFQNSDLYMGYVTHLKSPVFLCIFMSCFSYRKFHKVKDNQGSHNFIKKAKFQHICIYAVRSGPTENLMLGTRNFHA